MAYKVTLSGSSEGQKFCFDNYDDAFQFAEMAVESGTYQDYHYVDSVKTWDAPVPVAVTIVGVED